MTSAAEEAKALLPGLYEEEIELQFSRFTNDDALNLGLKLVTLAKSFRPGGAEPQGVAISITRSGQILFHHAMEGTTVDSENWLRRKSNTVTRLQHSSYLIGRQLMAKHETTMEKTYMVSMTDYACHGGAFPLLIKNVGCVGVITVSGLKQADDHRLVVTGIREMIQEMDRSS